MPMSTQGDTEWIVVWDGAMDKAGTCKRLTAMYDRARPDWDVGFSGRADRRRGGRPNEATPLFWRQVLPVRIAPDSADRGVFVRDRVRVSRG